MIDKSVRFTLSTNSDHFLLNATENCSTNKTSIHLFPQVTLTMDRFSSYPDWYVKSSRGKDEVPVGHSLTGFATAFDFLYPRFDPHQRKKYLDKMMEVTSSLYQKFTKHSGWPKQHIHNHAPTNLLAMLLGAMVLERNGGYPGSVVLKMTIMIVSLHVVFPKFCRFLKMLLYAHILCIVHSCGIRG